MILRDSIAETTLKCFQNVKDYKYIEENVIEWEIHCEAQAEPSTEDVPIYFILDTINHHAFAHWVFEDLVFVEEYKKLLQRYPNCQLVIDQERDYKKLFFKYFSIPYENVIVRSQMKETNFCYFHTYLSLNAKTQFSLFFERVEKLKSTFDRIQVTKDIPILYLPRGTKENLQGGNNRVYDVQEELKEIVKSLGGVVYETDRTTDLEEQVRMVKRSMVIILDYGSNLWVNGMFAEQSQIVCLNVGWRQHTIYPSYYKLWEEVVKRNKLTEFFAIGAYGKTENDVAIVRFQKEPIFEFLYNLDKLLRSS